MKLDQDKYYDMKKVISLILVLFVYNFIFTPGSFAEESLTQAQKEALQRRVKDKIDEFQFYLNQLADKESTSAEVKTNAYNLAIKLFVGECQQYSLYNPETNRNELKPAVRMQTSSLNSTNYNRTLMSKYLENLRYNKRYTQIQITDADAVRVDNIYRVGDHYECMAYFCQKFIGFRDGRVAYSDITTKKVKIYINAIEIPRPDGSTQTIWNAMLGDVYVLETKPI